MLVIWEEVNMSQRKPDHVTQKDWDAYQALHMREKTWHPFSTPEHDADFLAAREQMRREEQREKEAKRNAPPPPPRSPEQVAADLEMEKRVREGFLAMGRRWRQS